MATTFYKFIFSLTFGLGSSTAFALQASGEIHKVGHHLFLLPSASEKVLLGASNDRALMDLLLLDDGDQLVAEGERAGSSFLVSQVQFVGLRQLLGFWLSDDMTVVEVEDFRNFTTYAPLTPISMQVPQRGQYTLAPDEDSWFTLFLVLGDQVTTGRVRYLQNQLEIEVWRDRPNGSKMRLVRISGPPAKRERANEPYPN